MSLSRLQIPYMTTAQRVAIVPLDRDLVFDTDLRKIFVGNGSTLGGLSLSTDGAGMNWHGAYAGGHSYVINDIVSYNGSTYICILASSGNVPTNGTYWNLLAQGIDVADFMDKATFDPTSVGGDAFDMDNMVEGTNNKLVTATEKTNFHAPGSDNQDLSGLMVKASNLSDVSNAATARNNILPSKTSNSLKVLRVNSGETDYELATMSGGDVVGPGSSTDNAVARFDSTTGKIIQDSAVTIADTTGDITGGKYNTVAISGSSTPTLSVTGTAAVSGTNTGDNSPNTSIAATKLDDFTTPDDNTDLNANTTNHGLLLKATEPAATFVNVVAIGNAESAYSNKALFDSTAPSTQAFGDTAAAGTAVVAARRDHKHTMPAAPSGGTPALVLGTAATAGSSSNFLRADDTIIAFDTTDPSTQTYGDAAVVGSATVAARRDHKHAMPASTKDTTAATGVLKGNGSTISAATAGTDYAIGSTGLAGGQTIVGGTLTTQNLSLRPNAADLTTGAVATLGTLDASNSTTGSVTVAGGLAVNKRVYATDMTVTNTITGSVSGSAGSAGSVTGATFTQNLTVDNGNVVIHGNADDTSALTIGSGTVSVSGSNTGDQSGGTPAITLGTTNTAGSSPNFLRRDDTILAFDATAITAEAIGSTSDVGTATVAARRDHVHPMPTALGLLSGIGGGYAACATAIATAAKTVTLTGFSLVVGGTVGVTFTNGNSAATPTVNINGTGAIPLFRNGVAISTIPAGLDCLLMYDGTNYNMINPIPDTTAVTGMLKGDGSTITAGTDGTDYYSSARAIPAANVPNGISTLTTSIFTQSMAAGTYYYVTGSSFIMPASSKTGGGMSTNTTMQWQFMIRKTAAGTGAFNVCIYRGINGTTGDARDVTQSIGTATAAVDIATVIVTLKVTATGATGSYTWGIAVLHKAATGVGFGTTDATPFFTGTVSSVAMNTASLRFGIGVMGATGTTALTLAGLTGVVNNMS